MVPGGELVVQIQNSGRENTLSSPTCGSNGNLGRLGFPYRRLNTRPLFGWGGSRSQRSGTRTSLGALVVSGDLELSLVLLEPRCKHAAENILLVVHTVGEGEALRDPLIIPFEPEPTIQLQEVLVVPALNQAFAGVVCNMRLGQQRGMELQSILVCIHCIMHL